jgi:hypothetical protein
MIMAVEMDELAEYEKAKQRCVPEHWTKFPSFPEWKSEKDKKLAAGHDPKIQRKVPRQVDSSSNYHPNRSVLESNVEKDLNNLPPNLKQIYGDKKIPLHLVPSTLMIYAALAFKQGGDKYGPFNWRKSAVKAQTYVGAAMRHILAWQDGEDIDPESGIPHLAHGIACLGILADCTVQNRLIDDRPSVEKELGAGPLMRNLTK